MQGLNSRRKEVIEEAVGMQVPNKDESVEGLATNLAEILAIKNTVQQFSSAMESKMIDKLEEGWEGWDQERAAVNIKEKIVHNFEEFESLPETYDVNVALSKLVNIANLAMLLWNLEKNAAEDSVASEYNINSL